MITKTEDLQNYLTDASNMPGGHADKLFLPESSEEVSVILKEANEKGIPVTVSGARTGTVGGAVPFGGYLVSLERMNSIRSIDPVNRVAVAGAGVLLTDLQKAVETEGLFYPPDPTEWSCQLGGTVATNASGARSFKYGATREFVSRIEVVLPGGAVVSLRRGDICSRDGIIEIPTANGMIRAKLPTYRRPDVRKNVSGYFTGETVDAVDLFIGSEGTLGIVTEIEFRLLPRPRSFFSGIVFFENEQDLLELVWEARDRSFQTRDETDGGPAAIDACLLEYFDERALRFISERFPEVPANARGAVFFEQETGPADEEALLGEWNEMLEKHHADLENSWFTTTEADLEKLRAFRHALPVAVNERIVRYGQKKVGTDMAVPDDKLASFLRFYKEKLEESGLDYVIFGHIGDSHLHANILPKDDEEATRARHLYGRFVAQSIMLGGTISAEHGIGKHKSKYLYVQFGERYLNEMAEFKKAFDPRGILGRGNMFDPQFLA